MGVQNFFGGARHQHLWGNLELFACRTNPDKLRNLVLSPAHLGRCVVDENYIFNTAMATDRFLISRHINPT